MKELNKVSERKAWFRALPHIKGQGVIIQEFGPLSFADEAEDFIYVAESHVLGDAWTQRLRDLWSKIKQSGHLVLDVAGPAEGQRYGVEGWSFSLSHALDGASGWQLLECEERQGRYFIVWEKRADTGQWRLPWRKEQKHALIIRMGGYGDALMASSVFPALVDDGWHLSFLGNETTCDVLRHDPHLDEVLCIERRQVTDQWWPTCWQAIGERYDRVINLSDSVEGELLKHPSRLDYWWNEDQRRAICAKSYLERVHKLCHAPGPYRVKFYPSPEERRDAKAFADLHGPFLLWCLKGSAVHKTWPYIGAAICQVLIQSTIKIVLVADENAAEMATDIIKDVKRFYGDASRVISVVGWVNIRAAMALAQRAVVVVGPETGIMNAVSMERMPKVLFLSHSHQSNLSDDWVNAFPLIPHAGCYPCHRLHYSFETCVRDDDTGAAACSASIGIGDVVSAIKEAIDKSTGRLADNRKPPLHIEKWKREVNRYDSTIVDHSAIH